MISQTHTLADGRALDVTADLQERGPALVLHHGTPSDGTLWLEWAATANACGLRTIAMSRPGYGGSDRAYGRSVAAAADDLEAVLAAYDVPWFVTAGWSGGGPHALACAARLGDRCRAAASLAGVAPYDESDFDWLAGMGPENHAEFQAAGDGEPALRTWLTANASALREMTAAGLADAFGGLVAPVDRVALEDGFAERMASTMRRALAHGFDGWIDDDLAFLKPWGFDLEAIAVPVTVWQGDLDLMVPATHGAWLARNVPAARERTAPGHGHISLVTTYREEIVRDLMDCAGRG